MHPFFAGVKRLNCCSDPDQPRPVSHAEGRRGGADRVNASIIFRLDPDEHIAAPSPFYRAVMDSRVVLLFAAALLHILPQKSPIFLFATCVRWLTGCPHKSHAAPAIRRSQANYRFAKGSDLHRIRVSLPSACILSVQEGLISPHRSGATRFLPCHRCVFSGNEPLQRLDPVKARVAISAADPPDNLN